MKQFYLAGGIAGLTFGESNGWRAFLEDRLCEVKIINPVKYYNYEMRMHDSEKEIRNFELNLVRHSDLVIVNFNQPNSIGTAQELAVAYEHRIPIVGLNQDKNELHPWLIECVDKILYSMKDLVDYVRCYYY